MSIDKNTPDYNSAEDYDFEYLSEHTKHKLKSLQNTNFHKFLRESVKQSVKNCGSFLAFKLYQNIKNTEEFRRTLGGANFCKNRFCIMCAWRKAKQLQTQTFSTIRYLEEQNHKKYEFLFLTLTVPNCKMSELNSTVKTMSKAFNKLIHREEWKKAIKGFIRAVEFVGDHTEQGQAHPHYHCLLMVEKRYFKGEDYISQERFRELWSDCYSYPNLQVRIEKIKPKKKADGTVLPAIVCACYETIKYSMDLTDMNKLSDDDLKELMKQTRGIRQYNRGGLLKNLVEDLSEIDESVWQYLREEFYRWSQDHYPKLTPQKMKFN